MTVAPLVDAGRALGFAVLNRDSGPGTRRDAGYVDAARALANAEVAAVGYVDTAYGKRSPDAVRTDVKRWRRWYGITSIFFDQTPTAKRHLDRYRAYVDDVHDQDGRAIFNPGTYPDRVYVDLADVTVTYEGALDDYRALARPAWVSKVPAHRMWHLVYGTPEPEVANVLSLARSYKAGYVYVTDDTLPDPWNVLATYWPDLLAQVEAAMTSCRVASWTS